MDCGIARRERVGLLGGRERRITAALVVGSARWEVGLLVVGLLNEGKHFREGKCNGLDLES